jgi:hypothetical protein
MTKFQEKALGQLGFLQTCIFRHMPYETAEQVEAVANDLKYYAMTLKQLAEKEKKEAKNE